MFEFELIGAATSLIYFIGFVGPLALWGMLKYAHSEVEYSKVFCLYGYSLVTFIPVTLLCIIPVAIMRWILIAYGVAATAYFLVKNMKRHLDEVDSA